METIRAARMAMATRFEILLSGENGPRLRAIAEEALDEIVRLEGVLSLYRPDSEVSRINGNAAREWVRVPPEVFSLVERSLNLSELTGGAFDITVAPLVRAWGFIGGAGAAPEERELAEARAVVGSHLVDLSRERFSIRFQKPGVMIDLGSIGKGYAIEMAADLLLENGVASALIHGGTSAIYAIGKDAAGQPWRVAIDPPNIPDFFAAPPPLALAWVELENESLSVSAAWGKGFKGPDRWFGHVIDPRSGEPSLRGIVAAAGNRSATVADALSTAFMLAGKEEFESLKRAFPSTRALQFYLDSDQGDLRSRHASFTPLVESLRLSPKRPGGRAAG